jgi:tRNA threonylcarbamoyladenosine modification (KEOPS) complex Cgi121 subunit
MEVLLYASGERQLKIALPKMGIKNGMSNIAFILFDKSKVCNNINSEIVDNLLNYLSLKRCDDVLNGDEETLIRFGINRSEIYTVPKEKYKNLILERVAIVDIIK